MNTYDVHVLVMYIWFGGGGGGTVAFPPFKILLWGSVPVDGSLYP